MGGHTGISDTKASLAQAAVSFSMPACSLFSNTCTCCSTQHREAPQKLQCAAESDELSFKSTDRQLGCCLQMAALQDQAAQHEIRREVTPSRRLDEEVGQLQEQLSAAQVCQAVTATLMQDMHALHISSCYHIARVRQLLRCRKRAVGAMLCLHLSMAMSLLSRETALQPA